MSPSTLLSSAILARFLSGSQSEYDPSFGGGAGLVTPVSEESSQTFVGFRALAPDGADLVAVGSARKTFLVTRTTKDGNLDQSFGEGGQVVLPIAGPSAGEEWAHNWAMDVAPLGNGRMLLAGGTSEWGKPLTGKLQIGCGECPQPLLAVVNASGHLDPGFGSGGVLRLLKPDGSVLDGEVEQAAVLADGKILVKGTIPIVPSPEVRAPFLARLNPDGSYDPTFGEGGMTVIRFPCTDQSRPQRRRAGCFASLRAKVGLGGLRQRRPVLSLRVRPNLDWAAVSGLTLTLPKYLRLTQDFRSKLRVLGAGPNAKVHVGTPQAGKPYTVLAFSDLDFPRQLRVQFKAGALHLHGRLPRQGLVFKLRAQFVDSRWGSWAGHDEIARRVG